MYVKHNIISSSGIPPLHINLINALYRLSTDFSTSEPGPCWQAETVTSALKSSHAAIYMDKKPTLKHTSGTTKAKLYARGTGSSLMKWSDFMAEEAEDHPF